MVNILDQKDLVDDRARDIQLIEETMIQINQNSKQLKEVGIWRLKFWKWSGKKYDILVIGY